MIKSLILISSSLTLIHDYVYVGNRGNAMILNNNNNNNNNKSKARALVTWFTGLKII